MMRRSCFGMRQLALCIGIASAAVALSGCAKRYGGPWPFGTDQTADLAKYGPVPQQRIDAMAERAKKLRKAKPDEREAYARELAQQIQNETDVNVRLAIIDAMGMLNTPAAQAVLYAGLQDPEPDIRVACCEAWARNPGAESTRILSEILASDTNVDVRLAAVKGLAGAEDREAVKALALALEDPNPALQYRAVASLRSVTGQNLGNDVNAWRQLAQQPDPPLRSKSMAQRLRDMF